MLERERDSLIHSQIRGVMSSWRSSNIDEMVLAAFVEKGPLPPKEEGH